MSQGSTAATTKRNILQFDVSGMGRVAAHSNKRLLGHALQFLELPCALDGGTFVSQRKKLYTCWELVQHARDAFGVDLPSFLYLQGAEVLAKVPDHGVKFCGPRAAARAARAPTRAPARAPAGVRVEELDDAPDLFQSGDEAAAARGVEGETARESGDEVTQEATRSLEDECAHLRTQVAKYKRRLREAWDMRGRQHKLEAMMREYAALETEDTVSACDADWVKQQIRSLDRRAHLATEYRDELDRGIYKERKRREAQAKLLRAYDGAQAKVRADLDAIARKRQKLQAASDLIDECRD